MTSDKLVYMANQIGKFFVHEGEPQAVESITAHLQKFWDPRMRRAIIAHVEAGGRGLDPLPRRAVEAMRSRHAAAGAG